MATYAVPKYRRPPKTKTFSSSDLLLHDHGPGIVMNVKHKIRKSRTVENTIAVSNSVFPPTPWCRVAHSAGCGQHISAIVPAPS